MKLEDLKRSPTTVEMHTKINGHNYQGSVSLKDGIVEASVAHRYDGADFPGPSEEDREIASNAEQIRDLQFVVQGVLATIKEMNEKRGVG